MLALEEFRLQGRRQDVPLLEAVMNQRLQIIRDDRQPRGAVGWGFVQQGEQIPAQFRGAQAQFPFIGVKGFVLAHLGDNPGADGRRPVRQRVFPFGGRHGQQFAE